MHHTGSPPKYTELTDKGGSKSRGSKLSLLSTASSKSAAQLFKSRSAESKLLETNAASTKSTKELYHHAHAHAHHNNQSYHDHHGSNAGSSSSNGTSIRIISSSTGKRGRKGNWGTRERSGMSFLIVIAFFAIFGMIILTELFMIDERSHSAMVMMRHGGGYGGRLGDSMPDYDNVKEDYDLLDGSVLGDNKLGFLQFRDNKLKIQDVDRNGDAGRLAGVLLNSGGVNGYGLGTGGQGMGIGNGGGGGGGFNVPQIPWGKVLPMKLEETLPSYPVGLMPTTGSWQVVNGTRFKFFVFSAYYDRRDGAKLVRVIGATKTRGPERVWCRFWYLNRNVSSSANAATGNSRQRERFTSATVMARVKIIRENWNLKYSACFILCPMRGHEPDVPYYVSVVSRLRAPPGNLLTLRNTDWDMDFAAMAMANGNGSVSSSNGSASIMAASFLTSLPMTDDRIPDKIAVCVKPFHFNYDQALYLMEYLEFYALLGVSHFTFYNHTLGPRASCVLQHYVDGDVPDLMTAHDGTAAPRAEANRTTNRQSKKVPETTQRYVKPTVKILPWDLNMRSQKEIRTEGLFAALNDCLYRSMYRYKYVALVDLDEFIVPRHNDTIYDLITSLNRRFPNRNIGAYSFQNAFFYLQFPDDNLVYQDPKNGMNMRMRAALITQRKTKRRYKLHPQKQRSKYICKPEAVIEAGNHFVWEFSPGKGSLNVAPTEAILQHYRVCEFGGNDCIKAPSVIDRTATKYINRLVQRVESVYNQLKAVCELPELPALQKPITNDFNNENNINEEERQEKSSQIQGNKGVNERSTVTNITTSMKNEKLSKNATNLNPTPKTNVPKLTEKEAKPKSKKKAVPKAEDQTTTLSPKKLSKKRKFVVFEHDENGDLVGKLHYD